MFEGRSISRRHRAGLRDPCSLCPVPPHYHCHRGPHRHLGVASALGQRTLQHESPGGQSDPDTNDLNVESGIVAFQLKLRSLKREIMRLYRTIFLQFFKTTRPHLFQVATANLAWASVAIHQVQVGKHL